jgi:hypothetical protein
MSCRCGGGGMYRYLGDEHNEPGQDPPDLGIPENECVGRVTAFCSYQRDFCCYQEWLALLADATG